MAATTDAAVRARPWLAEVAGWLCALAVSVGVVAWAGATSDRLLYTDGDSMVVSMIARSLLLGQPQDWAMSPVLFLPETALSALLATLGSGVRATLTMNGVVNLLLLYGAVRLVAGRREPGREPVSGAVVSFAAFALLAMLEGSAELPGLQLATLTVTTTYYSMTVIASVAALGLIRRVLDGGPPVLLAVVLCAVSAVSVLTNPLFAVWTSAPAVIALAALALARRLPRLLGVVLVAAVVVGALAGYLARIPLAGVIVAADGNYVRPDRWMLARDHFGASLADTAATWHGILWIALLSVLSVACVVVAVRAWRRRDAARGFVAVVAVLSPVATTVGTIAIGTDADRYLQPWAFLPVLVLAVAPLPRMRATLASTLAAAAVAAALLVVAVPGAVAAATRDDADLNCVVGWVNASNRVGAGQFWTIRAPKAHVEDPRRLVQVDHTLRIYEWLTNRVDAEATEVSFLVQDPSSARFALPEAVAIGEAREISCGRYTVFDFGDRMLALGPPRN